MTAKISVGQPAQRRGFASFFPILGWLPKYERLAAQRHHRRPHRDGTAGAGGHGLRRAGGHAAGDDLLCRAGCPAALRDLRHIAPAGGRGLLGAGGHVVLDHLCPGAARYVRVHRAYQRPGDHGGRCVHSRRRASSRPHRPVLLGVGAHRLCLGPGSGGRGQAAAQAVWHRVRHRQRVGAALRPADPPAGDAPADAGRRHQLDRSSCC